MKKAILFLILAVGFSAANGQSLKDALFSGKLKSDSNSVVRKTDDLSTKIDTATKKKQAEPEKAKASPSVADSSSGKSTNSTNTTALAVNEADDAEATSTPEGAQNAPAKTNTKIWKEYMDSLATSLKEEVLSNKKVKKGTYYFYLDYEIGLDGSVSINNITVTPESDFLLQQVKERITYSAPQLQPVLDSNGKPRKTKRKYNFHVTRD